MGITFPKEMNGVDSHYSNVESPHAKGMQQKNLKRNILSGGLIFIYNREGLKEKPHR